MAVKGTQEAALFEGPLQADKADSSNPVRLWTLGELFLRSDWLHLQRQQQSMQAEDDLVEGWVLPVCSAEIQAICMPCYLPRSLSGMHVIEREGVKA